MKINLLKISFTITILGILLLLFITNLTTSKQISINQITNQYLNKQIKINATITQIQNKPSFQIITLTDSTGKIQAILPLTSNNLSINQNIILIGTLTQYKNSFQIQTNKIIQQTQTLEQPYHQH